MLSGQTVTLSDVVADPKTGNIYYLEDRPSENGRDCIVAYACGKTKDVLSKEYSTRTHVHEYGGASMAMASDGRVIFTVNTLGVLRSVTSGDWEH